jgi:phasin family protein
MTKSFTTKATVRKSPKTRAAARKASHPNRRQAAPKRATETARGTHRRSARFDGWAGDPQMPESVRAFAERSVAQTREVYEQSLEAVLESWERFIDAAGQGAAALNRSVIDMTRRNIHNSFGLAEHLAGAKNLAEAMEVQATYWRKQISELTAQSDEMQRLSTKLTADVAAPIKAQLTRGTRAFLRAR